jgi:hypothetical protein
LRVREEAADAVGQLARDAGLEVTRAADGRVARAFERHEEEPKAESPDEEPKQ